MKHSKYYYRYYTCILYNLLLNLHSFDWLATFHLELLQAILFIAL